MQARGVRVEWANSIKAAAGLLNSAIEERRVLITELGLTDGNCLSVRKEISPYPPYPKNGIPTSPHDGVL
jgi:hypothetical protein